MITEKSAKPPTPKNKHWLMGHSKALIDDILTFFSDIQKECGNVVRLTSYVASGQMYVLYDTDAIKRVLVENQKNYRKGKFIKMLKPILGDGLVTSDGEFWKKQRRLIQPSFYKDNIFRMMYVMGECVDEMVTKWEQTYQDGDLVDISKEFNYLALKIVTRALFKTDLGDDLEHVSNNLHFVIGRIMNRFKNPFAYAEWIPSSGNKKEQDKIKSLQSIVDKLIVKKKAGEIPDQGDVLDMLLAVKDEETGEGMPDLQIRDELITILLAGHETTATTLSFIMYELVNNPEVYKKVDQYITENQLTGAPEEIKEAEYLKQVAMETLRLNPPVFFLQRKAVEDDTINGFHIPAGMNVAIPVFTIHRLEQYWKDPKVFNPDRFEKEAFKNQPKYSFVGFGGGPRLCIGDQFSLAEIVIALIKIQNKFYFKPNDAFQFEYLPEMSLRTKDPIELPIFRK